MGCSISKKHPFSTDNLVCSLCRESLFNFHSFQQAWQGSFHYTTGWGDIQSSNRRGCHWCDMIYAETDRVLCTLRDPNQTQFQGTRESMEETARQICDDKIQVEVSIRDKKNISGYTYDINEAGQTTHTEGQELLITFTSEFNGKVLNFLSMPISTASGMTILIHS